jgi:hypothetical protein
MHEHAEHEEEIPSEPFAVKDNIDVAAVPIFCGWIQTLFDADVADSAIERLPLQKQSLTLVGVQPP